MAQKRCVQCGKKYVESNGYGLCLACEDGTDHEDRAIARTKQRKLAKHRKEKGQ